jgi:hypothetical protein
MTGLLDKEGRKVFAVLALLGFLLAAPNLFSFYARYYAEATEDQVSETTLMWNPVKSPLLHAWPAAYRQAKDAEQSDVRELLSQRKEVAATSISGSRALRIVAIWWWVLPIVHISRLWGVLVSTLLVLAGVWLLVLARRRSYGDANPDDAGIAIGSRRR